MENDLILLKSIHKVLFNIILCVHTIDVNYTGDFHWQKLTYFSIVNKLSTEEEMLFPKI